MSESEALQAAEPPPAAEPPQEPPDDGAKEASDGVRPAAPVAGVTGSIRRRASALRSLLGATAAWLVTVAPIAVATKATPLARALALAAIVPGILGPLWLASRTRLARHLGLTAFPALAGASWVAASLDGVLPAIGSFRAVLGAAAWAAFALSWSHPWSVPEADLARAPEGATVGLRPRRRTPGYALAVAVIGAVAAASCLALAWGIDDPSRALLAQAVATGSAIALLTSSATVSAIAGKDWKRVGEAGRRLPIDRRVLNTILLMLIVAAGAVALRWTR